MSAAVESSTWASARPRRAGADALAVVFGVAVGVALAAPVVDGTLAEVHAPGGSLLAASTLTGLVGSVLAWIMVVLASRMPWLDQAIGQPRVMRWHRQVAPWAIGLITAHVILAIGAAAVATHTSFFGATGQVVTSSVGLVEATIAAVVLVVVGAISVPWMRSRIPRERWWALHLALYGALALAVAHELALGPTFIRHPLARAVWIVAWVLAALGVIVFRLIKPWRLSRALDLRVAGVRTLGDGRYVEVEVAGARPLSFRGGQYCLWRLDVPGRRLEAHPFTVLHGREPGGLRLVARRIGDFTDDLANVGVGTRVRIEGPYGSFTVAERCERRAILVAGGAGQTATLALLADLDAAARPQVIVRVSDEADLVLGDEIRRLVAERHGSMRVLVGSRREVPLSAIFEGVGELRSADVWIAGPPAFVTAVGAAALQRGARRRAIHGDPYTI